MISLISRWRLKKAGAPPALVAALRNLARKVKESEPGTLMYMVHLDAPNPLDDGTPILPPPPPIPPDEQTEVVFIEIYADAQAFADHLSGPTFTTFLAENLKYFEENPNSKGWPVSDTIYLDRESAFIRPQAGETEPAG